MALSPDEFFQVKLLDGLARLGKIRVQPRIPSKTLQKGLNTFVESPTRAYIQIPHYWAVYLHDGRGSFGPVTANFLVYFRDPRNDPRTPRPGISPVRAHHARRLTKAEFQFWLAKNRQNPGRPPMIIRSRVGPQRPSPWFENNSGMSGFLQDANHYGGQTVVQYFQKKMKKEMLFELDSVRLRI